VLYESQHAEDVTKQFVDLNARLNNARNTEQRLTELLRNRTGKLSDVLAVEEQIDTVRGQIEGMEAEMKNLSKQVDYSSVALTVTEEYNLPLSQTGNPRISTRLRNAAVEGYHNLVGAIVALASWTLTAGPVLLLIAALLFLPARLIWRKMRVRV
jgi:predicted phage tail protein